MRETIRGWFDCEHPLFGGKITEKTGRGRKEKLLIDEKTRREPEEKGYNTG